MSSVRKTGGVARSDWVEETTACSSWWRPKGGDRLSRFRYDSSLNRWLKTVLLFKRGEIKILQRDAHMVCPTTEEDAFEKGENKHRALARPPVEVAGAIHPRSTYRGARQPEGGTEQEARSLWRIHRGGARGSGF